MIALNSSPPDPVSANVELIGDSTSANYSITIANSYYQDTLPDPGFNWETGLISIPTCVGDSAFGLFNFSPLAQNYFVVLDYCDNSLVFGCTNPEALNFDPQAEFDDGSCFLEEDCDGNVVEVVVSTEMWGSEISWNIFQNGDTLGSGFGYTDFDISSSFICLQDGCYVLEMKDSFGDGWNDATYTIIVNDEEISSGTLEEGHVGYASFGVNETGCDSLITLGCTDPDALNYNPDAAVDDGSCQYPAAENDLCADAIPLNEGLTLIDNTNTPNNEGVFGECWNFGSGEGEQNSVWFTITTPAEPAEIHIEAIGDSSFTLLDTQFGLFEECGGEMIYCDGNSGAGLLSSFDFACGELEANSTYLLVVDGWNGDAGTCYLSYEITQPCDTTIEGCTDPEALNYNPAANVDDGSCEYFECDANTVVLTLTTENWAEEISWNIVDEAGAVVATGANYLNFTMSTQAICLEDGCYNFEMFDSFGDGWNGAEFTLTLDNTIIADGTLLSGNFETIAFGVNETGCEPEIFGCTDPDAINYDPNATADDGSCEYFECDANTLYLGLITQNFGSEISWSILDSIGNVIAAGDGYESYSVTFESFCLEDGCYTLELFDSFGDGWNGSFYELILEDTLLATGTLVSGDSGAIAFGINQSGCTTNVFGCTDPDALNFNPDATVDDGSCEFFECEENTLQLSINTQNWGSEISWNIVDESGTEVAGNGNYADFSSTSEAICLQDGCYTFEMFDSFGDGWNGAEFTLALGDSTLAGGTLDSGNFGAIAFGVNEMGCIPEIFGCTDPEASNYNPLATVDDGSCEYTFECGISFQVIPDSTGDNSFTIIPSENIANAVEVLWEFGDGHTSTDMFPTHMYEEDGPYLLCLYVTFADSSGGFCEISYCEELSGSIFGSPGFLSGGFTVNVIPEGTLSDGVNQDSEVFAVYPNPTDGMTTIQFSSDGSDNLRLRILDMRGKLLESRILNSVNGDQNFMIDLSNQPQGIYLLGLERDGKISYAKVIRR